MNPEVVGPRTGSCPLPRVYSAWGTGVGGRAVRASSLGILRVRMHAPLSPQPPFPMRSKRGARDSCRCAAQRLQDSYDAKPPDTPRCTKPTREVEHFVGN